MKTSILVAAAFLAVLADHVAAQNVSSIGLGAVLPQSEYADAFDPGFTIRLQSSASYPQSEVQFQSGWSRFRGRDVGGAETDSADLFHVSLGVRLGRTLFVGANVGYFWGDTDDGFGFFPETGVRLGRIELVADYRVDGDDNWLGVRAGLRF